MPWITKITPQSVETSIPGCDKNHASHEERADSFHRALELLPGCGRAYVEVLKVATLNGAKLLKIDNRVGTIQTGKEADLVLLNANPLSDIKNTRDIHMTIANGMVVHRQD